MNNKQNLESIRNVLKKENEVYNLKLKWINENKLSRITLGKDLEKTGINGNSYYVYVKYYCDKQSNGMEIFPLVIGMTRNKIVKGVPKGGDLIFQRGYSNTKRPNAKTFLDCINCMNINFDGVEKDWDEWFEKNCMKEHFQYNQPRAIGGGNINLYNNKIVTIEVRNKEDRCKKYENLVSSIEEKYDWYTEEILVINCGDDRQLALEIERKITNLLKKETIIYGS